MSAGTTLTIRVPPETKSRLAELAQKTRRSNSFLANEAIEAYLTRELDIIAGIEEGLADIAAGRVSSEAINIVYVIHMARNGPENDE